MEKDVAIIVIVVLFGALVFVGLINNVAKDISLSPNVSYSPTITYPICSNQSIASLWDQVFSVSSSGIITYFKEPVDVDSHIGCPYFIAYKINSNEIYFLSGTDLWPTNNATSNGTVITAFKANVTQAYLNNISAEGIQNYTNYGDFSTTKSVIYISSNYLQARNLAVDDSNQTFLSSFKFNDDVNWSNKSISTYESFAFNESLYVSSTYKFVSGLALRDYTYDYFIYTDKDTNDLTCVPNYVPFQTSCNSNGTYSTYFKDVTDCDSTPKLNISLNCNYINTTQAQNVSNSSNNNNNKTVSEHLSGNLTKFLENNTGVMVYIDNNTLNLSEIINVTKNIEFRKSADTLFKFDYNFSSAANINLDSLEIIKQNSSDSFGFLVVNGLSFNKTFYVDRVANVDYLCIKNTHVSNINSLSSECNASSEVLLLCPGSSNSISCNISNNKFIVSGLTNSGVKEFISTSPVTTTVPILTVPQPTACTPSWTCGDWTPKPCSTRQNQTRMCADNNNCNDLQGKPSEIRECDADAGSPLPTIIFYSTLILILASIIIIVVIFYLSTRKKDSFGREKLI